MTSLREFQAELERLHQNAERARRADKATALATIRGLIAEYDLVLSDLGINPATARPSKSPPRYRDPLTGATWTGKGRVPHWLNGQDRAKFLIG